MCAGSLWSAACLIWLLLTASTLLLFKDNRTPDNTLSHAAQRFGLVAGWNKPGTVSLYPKCCSQTAVCRQHMSVILLISACMAEARLNSK